MPQRPLNLTLLSRHHAGVFTLHVSLGCRYVDTTNRNLFIKHGSQMPITDLNVVFSGFHSRPSKSLINFFAHLIRIKDHAHLVVSNTTIAVSIRHIELRNWVSFWSRGLSSIDRRDTSTGTLRSFASLKLNHPELGSTRATLRRELVALWLSALKTTFALINSLPNLRTISFHETYQVSTYESNRPLNPCIFEGSAIFENEASPMVSPLLRAWEKSQTSPTF
ncbi:hypothetical protein M422DRAFT_264079 [Sphaerobolus stellatus SS14]|uniref:Uncharacterized protein n=1 Tax=Sphaerobolus stellatus (strain SS14) TaxID=990650 RepID=A0A0C9V919_SPHS4|nr:hypothetical protein M422DRAFT_264079 [Sphaerobolus stellatus SS14]